MDIHMVDAESELQDARDVVTAFTVLAIGGAVCVGVIFFFLG